MKKKMTTIAIGLALVTMMISIVPSVFACDHYYTPGYWKHNVRVYVEGQGSYSADIDKVKESDALMECYEAWIQANRDPSFTLEGANADFWLQGPGVQARRQELADWFNYAKYYC